MTTLHVDRICFGKHTYQLVKPPQRNPQMSDIRRVPSNMHHPHDHHQSSREELVCRIKELERLNSALISALEFINKGK